MVWITFCERKKTVFNCPIKITGKWFQKQEPLNFCPRKYHVFVCDSFYENIATIYSLKKDFEDLFQVVRGLFKSKWQGINWVSKFGI